jgi:hypothetical protein
MAEAGSARARQRDIIFLDERCYFKILPCHINRLRPWPAITASVGLRCFAGE